MSVEELQKRIEELEKENKQLKEEKKEYYELFEYSKDMLANSYDCICNGDKCLECFCKEDDEDYKKIDGFYYCNECAKLQDGYEEEEEKELSDLTVKELKEKCKEQDITGYSKLKKEALIKLLTPLEELSVKELKEKCKEQGIKGYSKLKKQQLLDVLKNLQMCNQCREEACSEFPLIKCEKENCNEVAHTDCKDEVEDWKWCNCCGKTDDYVGGGWICTKCYGEEHEDEHLCDECYENQ